MRMFNTIAGRRAFVADANDPRLIEEELNAAIGYAMEEGQHGTL
jgi:hypothetical protein